MFSNRQNPLKSNLYIISSVKNVAKWKDMILILNFFLFFMNVRIFKLSEMKRWYNVKLMHTFFVHLALGFTVLRTFFTCKSATNMRILFNIHTHTSFGCVLPYTYSRKVIYLNYIFKYMTLCRYTGTLRNVGTQFYFGCEKSSVDENKFKSYYPLYLYYIKILDVFLTLIPSMNNMSE